MHLTRRDKPRSESRLKLHRPQIFRQPVLLEVVSASWFSFGRHALAACKAPPRGATSHAGKKRIVPSLREPKTDVQAARWQTLVKRVAEGFTQYEISQLQPDPPEARALQLIRRKGLGPQRQNRVEST